MAPRPAHVQGSRKGALSLAAAVVAVVALTGCGANPHYIGDVCPGAAGASGACVTFAVGLERSGVSGLEAKLALPAGPMGPIERLRGEAAMDAVWTADVGGELGRSAGVPALDLEAPFTDDTRAVGLAGDAASYVATAGTTAALGADDFVIEIVLRAAAGATLFEKRAGVTGWVLHGRDDGALVLGVGDERAATFELASAPLVEDAWTHCLAWLSRRDGGRIDCDGRAGETVDVATLGDLDGAARLAAGGGSAMGRVALLAIYRVPRGGLGPATGWREIGARRFAALTGAGATALGTATPGPGMRDSPAYVDLQRSVGAARRLFLVGLDWPRVACRTDAANARDCGYLSEPARTRFVPGDAHGFVAGELVVRSDQMPFADGKPQMEALVPSTARGAHTLMTTSPPDAAHHVFSFFARAGASSRVAASADRFLPATFDVAAGTVVSAPVNVDVSIEAWGDGLYRCTYGFNPSGGMTQYRIYVLAPGASTVGETFAGDGVSAATFIAGLQVDVGLRAPGSLLAADTQAADHLAFVANDGNLPARAAMSFALRVIAPAAPRATDQPILNLNRAGRSEDQVQLFVSGQSGSLKYAGTGGGVSRWAIEHATPLADGQRHVIEGAWSPTSARLAINGAVDTRPTLVAGPVLAFDQIDVAFSPQTSDHLEGLVAGLRISNP